MAIILGLAASYEHSQNGMTRADMMATKGVVDRLGEVVIFRSTGPWAKRWIERGYPTKNFHVKGKSSDWGPHAGLVPSDGVFSKVGYDSEKAKKGSAENVKGEKSGFAGTQQLTLSLAEINDQVTKPEGDPPRTAVLSKFPIQGSDDLILLAARSGDSKTFAFRAVKAGKADAYAIWACPEKAGTNVFKLIDAPLGSPLLVMTSGEVGGDKPMTGDYDLFAICPTWASYGSLLPHDVVKPGVQLRGPKGLQPEARFSAGVGMDNVLDPELHTASNFGAMKKGVMPAKAAHRVEHPDMGNLTPRILRCINALNTAMGATGSSSPLRRVHHNAESHRNAMFGALTAKDMVTFKDGERFGDGFPLTVFQPAEAYRAKPKPSPIAKYGDVFTIESLLEFKQYAADLYRAGYFVPQNWIWGMSKMMDISG